MTSGKGAWKGHQRDLVTALADVQCWPLQMVTKIKGLTCIPIPLYFLVPASGSWSGCCYNNIRLLLEWPYAFAIEYCAEPTLSCTLSNQWSPRDSGIAAFYRGHRAHPHSSKTRGLPSADPAYMAIEKSLLKCDYWKCGILVEFCPVSTDSKRHRVKGKKKFKGVDEMFCSF